jgi:hypothetical protein
MWPKKVEEEHHQDWSVKTDWNTGHIPISQTETREASTTMKKKRKKTYQIREDLEILLKLT